MFQTEGRTRDCRPSQIISPTGRGAQHHVPFFERQTNDRTAVSATAVMIMSADEVASTRTLVYRPPYSVA